MFYIPNGPHTGWADLIPRFKSLPATHSFTARTLRNMHSLSEESSLSIATDVTLSQRKVFPGSFKVHTQDPDPRQCQSHHRLIQGDVPYWQSPSITEGPCSSSSIAVLPSKRRCPSVLSSLTYQDSSPQCSSHCKGEQRPRKEREASMHAMSDVEAKGIIT